MAKKIAHTIGVSLKLVVDIALDLTADSLEAAITQARGLKLEDVIDTKGLNINDSEVTVSGAYLND